MFTVYEGLDVMTATNSTWCLTVKWGGVDEAGVWR